MKNPGDWAFFTDNGVKFIKAMLPIAEVVVPYETAGDLRRICLPVTGAGAYIWNGDENAPTLEPSIKTEVVVGYTEDFPRKPILKEIYHGHLTNGAWNP